MPVPWKRLEIFPAAAALRSALQPQKPLELSARYAPVTAGYSQATEKFPARVSETNCLSRELDDAAVRLQNRPKVVTRVSSAFEQRLPVLGFKECFGG